MLSYQHRGAILGTTDETSATSTGWGKRSVVVLRTVLVVVVNVSVVVEAVVGEGTGDFTPVVLSAIDLLNSIGEM